ncbi:copper resistance protein CopC [Mycobacterium sp. NPDC051804]|uniref:copper resistance protein CopC n=1 Tax=Mycobacterium sp. NPDC051804 TaxID=3364295 RepID=UPI0037B76517
MRSTKHIAALAILMFALAVGTLGNAGVAAAHAARIASDPAENAVLPQAPARVSATFNEEMQPEFAAMTVVGPDGNLWSTGEPQVDGAIISVGVRPLGPSGTYTVNYRATSADGHVVSGSWSFQLTVAGTGAAGPPVSATPPAADASGASADDGGIPVWPFYVGAVLIVGAGVLWAARRRK